MIWEQNDHDDIWSLMPYEYQTKYDKKKHQIKKIMKMTCCFYPEITLIIAINIYFSNDNPLVRCRSLETFYYNLFAFSLSSAIQAGWKESHATFIKELKNLTATGLTSLGSAIKHTLDLLNVNRMTSGIDTYGQVYSNPEPGIFDIVIISRTLVVGNFLPRS